MVAGFSGAPWLQAFPGSCCGGLPSVGLPFALWPFLHGRPVGSGWRWPAVGCLGLWGIPGPPRPGWFRLHFSALGSQDAHIIIQSQVLTRLSLGRGYCFSRNVPFLLLLTGAEIERDSQSDSACLQSPPALGPQGACLGPGFPFYLCLPGSAGQSSFPGKLHQAPRADACPTTGDARAPAPSLPFRVCPGRLCPGVAGLPGLVLPRA